MPNKTQEHPVLELPRVPPPAPRSRKGVFILVPLILLLGLGAWFWFSRSGDVQQAMIQAGREAFRQSVESGSVAPLADGVRKHVLPEVYSFASGVSEAVSGLVRRGNGQTGSAASGPAVLPPLPSAPGSLSGRDIQAPVLPPEAAPELGEPAAPGAVQGAVAPQVKEDSVVRPLFVEDVARWLVSRYKPGKGGGTVNIGVQAANLRYGAGLHGLAPDKGDDPIGARGALLRYAFNAPMLEALYNLYVDHFMEALAEAAAEPGSGAALTPEQTDDMYRQYASRLAALAGAVRGIAAVPDVEKRLKELDALGQKSIEAHRALNEAVFELDEARESGNETRINTAQMRVNGGNARYRRSVEERAVAQNALLAAIKKGGAGAAPDDDSILFLAFWLERRLASHSDAVAALAKAGSLLEDLSLRLGRAASVAR